MIIKIEIQYDLFNIWQLVIMMYKKLDQAEGDAKWAWHEELRCLKQ